MNKKSNDSSGFWGLIGLGILIVLWVRADGWAQFGVMLAFLLVGIFAFLMGVGLILQDSVWSGLIIGVVGVLLVWGAGTFIFTGDYDRALRVPAVWLWGREDDEGETAVSESNLPLKVSPTPTATPQPTPTPSPQPNAAADLPDNFAWLATGSLSDEDITQGLNEIWQLEVKEAEETAVSLQNSANATSGETESALLLLTAAAHERANQIDSAQTIYQTLADSDQITYATSADFRLRLLSTPPDEQADTYKAIAEELEGRGWFLIADTWQQSSAANATQQALLSLRDDRLSFLFFQFLWERSPFSQEYAYLFILLVLTIGVKIVTLPLLVGNAKLMVQLRLLQPEIRMLQVLYPNDPTTLQAQTNALYERRGVNVYNGCAVAIVDLIFVVWALATLSSFSPQFSLDGANLFWITDVTDFDLWIIVLWAALSFIQSYPSSRAVGQTTGQIISGFVLSAAILGAMAWFWQWPAYAFIFWLLLTLLSVLVQGVLTNIWTAVARQNPGSLRSV